MIHLKFPRWVLYGFHGAYIGSLYYKCSWVGICMLIGIYLHWVTSSYSYSYPKDPTYQVHGSFGHCQDYLYTPRRVVP